MFLRAGVILLVQDVPEIFLETSVKPPLLTHWQLFSTYFRKLYLRLSSIFGDLLGKNVFALYLTPEWDMIKWSLSRAKMFTCGWDCDPDTDRSVPMVTNLDTAAIARQSKSADDIIRSATFPAAHAPSPDDSSRSEGDQWPYSLAVLGTVGSWWACLHRYLLGVQ